MPPRPLSGHIAIGILVTLLVISGVWYVAGQRTKALAPTIAEKPSSTPTNTVTKPIEKAPAYESNHVVVNLKGMTVELRVGTTTLETFSIVSIGKPGSYYETIGGAHINDYKTKNHFSSFGEVYMPWSTHVFGNYFIHGIPYYPDGTRVSTAYSGGCVRLNDNDAKKVYEFVSRGTPIILTQGSEFDFVSNATSTPDMLSTEMTQLMVAAISLELLNQDTEIVDTDGVGITTRKQLIPRLLNGDAAAGRKIVQPLGEKTFLMYMNQKASALGMTNTTFTGTNEDALTTSEDIVRFASYINSYKSYLNKVASTTQRLSQ